MSRTETSLSSAEKARLALRILRRFAFVRARIVRTPLPELVDRIDRSPGRAVRTHSPARLSGAVDRCLRIGHRRPTCLASALVLYSLLREQGQPAEVVIGLPEDPVGRIAHAWVEVDGVDAGPPPGRGSHSPLARYGG